MALFVKKLGLRVQLLLKLQQDCRTKCFAGKEWWVSDGEIG